jgi:hypothetical protein
MSSMRPIRAIGSALLVASLAVAGCSRSQPDQTTTPADQPPAAATAPAPTDVATDSQPAVLADGRHPIILKAIDPGRRTITFDLIQMYWLDDAEREAAKDHQRVDDDYYIRNLNSKLRTLPVGADAPITVNTIATWTGSATKNVSVTLPQLATLQTHGAVFYITVRHDQVVQLAQQYLP